MLSRIQQRAFPLGAWAVLLALTFGVFASVPASAQVAPEATLQTFNTPIRFGTDGEGVKETYGDASAKVIFSNLSPQARPITVNWTIRLFDVSGAAIPDCAGKFSIVPDASQTDLPGTCTLTRQMDIAETATNATIFVGAKVPLKAKVEAAVTFGTAGTDTETIEILVTDMLGPTAPAITGMTPDPIVTSFGHFTIRARDLLGYALRMKQKLDANTDENPIYLMYAQTREVANVLFIVALMLIAVLYNFSLLISRERLRRLLILFVMAMIGVNFSYTMASLAIQGSDRLFNIMLVREDNVKLGSDEAGGGNVSAIISGTSIEEVDLLTMKNFTYSGFVGASKTDPVDAERDVDRDLLPNNRFRENIIFNLAMMTAGAVAQFAIVLVLLARIVILWTLIIVAPFFFLLAIFKFSQEIFKYWGWFFTRWLLIGPLLGLFLSANVRIWNSAQGIPITSTYERADMNTFFPNIINIWVAAPGVRDAQGINLETPDQVVKYLMGLMMMYLALLLPFWLTRRITIFSGDKPSLLSRILGGDRAKVQKPVMKEPKPEQPKPPLKGGFTFNEAKVGAAVGAAAARTTASAGVTARVASERTAAANLSASGLSAVQRAGASAAAQRSTQADALIRSALQHAGAQPLAALTNREKPRALPRSLDAKVQAVARTATKKAVSANELAALTNEELGELRTHLSSFAHSSVLGTDSAVLSNLRSVERELQSRAESRAQQHEVRVKIQGFADRAEKGAISQNEFSMLRLAELQALKQEIESRVHERSDLAQNQLLRANYENLTAQLSAQAMSAIASITPAITAQTGAIIAALGRTEAVTEASLRHLSIPELKEASLAIHRMERAIRSQASLQAVRTNMQTIHSQLEKTDGADGALDASRVDALVSAAMRQSVALAELADLSRAELRAAAAELAAIEALGSAVEKGVTVNVQAPEYKESVVNVHAELKARGDDTDDGSQSNPELMRFMLRKLFAGNALQPAELVTLSRGDLLALNREMLAVGGGPGGLPTGPLDGDALLAALAALDHEIDQRAKVGHRVEGDTHVQILAVLKKVRTNTELAPAELALLSDTDLAWLRSHVDGLLASVRGTNSLDSAVAGIQAELKLRRLQELATQAAAQSPKVAELFTAVTNGAAVKDAAVAGLRLEDLRVLAEAVEKSANLVAPKIARAATFTASLRTVERAYQRKSLALLVQKVLEASAAATGVLLKVKAPEPIAAAELENLTLPELEAVQAESYRLNLIAPPALKQQATYRDNLVLIAQVYEMRVLEGNAGAGSDQRFRFIAGLQEAIGATLADKIAQLKTANKDDLAAELTAEQEDLAGFADRSAELAAERAEWIEYFRITPVPKVEGIADRAQWITAEQNLTRAIYDEIASQDWVVQAKGIADAAQNLLMADTASMSPIQILTALAIKEAAAAEALQLVRGSDDAELVFVPAQKQAAAAQARLRSYDEDAADEAARAARAATIETPPSA